MSKDKSIEPADLPAGSQKETSKQPEEFIGAKQEAVTPESTEPASEKQDEPR